VGGSLSSKPNAKGSSGKLKSSTKSISVAPEKHRRSKTLLTDDAYGNSGPADETYEEAPHSLAAFKDD
jgi:hypothetical protein